MKTISNGKLAVPCQLFGPAVHLNAIIMLTRPVSIGDCLLNAKCPWRVAVADHRDSRQTRARLGAIRTWTPKFILCIRPGSATIQLPFFSLPLYFSSMGLSPKLSPLS